LPEKQKGLEMLET